MPPPPWWHTECLEGSAPQRNANGTAECVECSAGWHGTQDDVSLLRSCEPCPARMLQPMPGQAICEACPLEGVDCTVQDQVLLLTGWFRPAAPPSANMSVLAPVRCPKPEGCLGGPNVSDGSCAEGHVGALCGACAEGYHMSSTVCEECATYNGAGSMTLYVLSGIAVIVAAFAYLCSRMEKAETHSTKGSQLWARTVSVRTRLRARRNTLRTTLGQLEQRARPLGSIGKILLAYFQVLYAFSQLKSIRWPSAFARYLDLVAPLSFRFFSALPLDCVVSLQISLEQRIVTLLLLPPAGLLAVLLLGLLAAHCRCLPKQERGLCAVAARPEVCTLQLWLLLLVYPSLANTTLIPFDCVTVGEQRLLRASPTEACDDDRWYTLAALGGIGTAVYSFGFPLFCFLVARAGRHAPVGEAVEEPSGAPGKQGAPPAASGKAVRRAERARLVLRSYTAEHWYWESLDIFRKYLLTSVVLVVAHNTLLQVYVGLLVCVVASLLLARHQPYADPICGTLQMLCLTQLTFTYMSGMLFFDDGGAAQLWWEEHEQRWAIALITANTLIYVLLARGLCGAVGSAVVDAKAEVQQFDEERRNLEAELASMRELLAEPSEASAGLRRAQISASELDLREGLGKGAFGEVFKAFYRGTPVAVKKMHAHQADAAMAKHAKAFRDEVLLLLELRHPNIVQLIGGSWDVDSGDMCLVLELCARGSLEQLLEDTLVQLTWVETLLPLATGVARGMAYLHGQSPPIVHRDLKPANVLLSSDLTPKIGDMGTALEMSEGAEEEVANAGSPLFQAPEVLRREMADGMCDVWSFGCLMCCLSTRNINPYEPVRPTQAVSLVAELRLRPHVYSPLATLIEKACELEYEDRPSFEEMLRAHLEADETLAAAREADAAAAARRGNDATRVSSGGATAPNPARMPRPKPAAAAASSNSTQAAAAALVAALSDGAESSRKTSTAQKDRRGSLDFFRAAQGATRTNDGIASVDEAAAAAEYSRNLKQARRMSLQAADSIEDLVGRKEAPGPEVSEKRRSALEKKKKKEGRLPPVEDRESVSV